MTQVINTKKKYVGSAILKLLIYGSAVITIAIVAIIILYVTITGIPQLKPSLFAWKYTPENCSMTPAIINTITIVFLSLLIALPVGIFSALYLCEYARRESKLVKVIRTVADTLSGIPSIVYGLFGYLMFAVSLHWGYSILSGALTLSIMILPLIMRTFEEAILSVPDMYREGSYGLGAGKVRTIFSIILPTAMPGILAGVILSIGRIVGETAALIYTAGTVAGIPSTVMGSGRTLSVHMYVLMSEGLHMDQAKGVAVVLLALVLGMNALSSFVAKRIDKNGNE